MSIAGTLQDSVNIRYVFTISGTPTTVSGADDNSRTLAYTEGQADVYLNGVKQVVGTDVTATSGSSVVFASALAANDVVEVVAFDTFQAAAINADNITSGTLNTARIADDSITNDKLANPKGRNLIINGDMRINQRGFASDVDNDYTVDRFVYQSSQADKFTITQDTDTPSGEGFVNSLKFVTASAVSIGASDYFMITQAIEGYNAAVLNLGTSSARTFTLSFWTRSSLTGTFGGAIGNAGTRYYPFTYTISSADTWERKTVTVAGDTTGTWATDASHGLIVRFGLGVGSTKSGTAGAWAAGEFFSATGATSVVGTGSATWYLTGVQVEAGSTASDFEHIQYTEQIQLCERYFNKSYALSVAPGTANTIEGSIAIRNGNFTDNNSPFWHVSFPTRMRTEPTVTTFDYAGNSGKVNGPSNASVTATAYQIDERGFNILNSSGSSVAKGDYYCNYKASAEL